jgi:hypothetical protein
MNRRKLLQVVGGIGTAAAGAGLGMTVMTGSAAAATVNITSGNPGQVSNDRGDVSQVTVDPTFDLTWQNLDDAVGKVFYLVEAKVGGSGSWEPIFRATPWVTQPANTGHLRQQPGTTGRYTIKTTLAQALNQDSRFSDGSAPDISASPLVVADEQGRPDYSSLSFPSGVDLSSFLDGTSIGSASDYPGAHEAGGHQNNYHDIDAGYYGAAADTSVLDNDADGSAADSSVQIRYTFELQRPNLSQLSFHPDVDFSGLSTDQEKKEHAAEEIDWVEVEDIDAGDSKIVMNGEDGNTNFGQNHSYGAGISYSALRNNAGGHVGILSETAAFVVTARNEPSDSGVTGSTNPGAN